MREQGVNPGLSVRKSSVIGIFLPNINLKERGGADGPKGPLKESSILGSSESLLAQGDHQDWFDS